MKEGKEGELYKTVELSGHTLELRYGYYEERERERGEPIPIYPDLKKNPLYTKDGYPLITQMQELCEHGASKFADGYCVDCKYFTEFTDLFGICKNAKNKQEIEK